MEPKVLQQDFMSDLIALWIKNNYHLSELPWYITDCTDLNDFLETHNDVITLNVLRYEPRLVPELIQMQSATSLSEILKEVSSIIFTI